MTFLYVGRLSLRKKFMSNPVTYEKIETLTLLFSAHSICLRIRRKRGKRVISLKLEEDKDRVKKNEKVSKYIPASLYVEDCKKDSSKARINFHTSSSLSKFNAYRHLDEKKGNLRRFRPNPLSIV